jgi:hypothetical protein
MSEKRKQKNGKKKKKMGRPFSLSIHPQMAERARERVYVYQK